MSLRAILFDVDGTLADTEPLGHRPAYNRAFRKMGLSFRWGPKLYRKLLRHTGGQERLSHYLKRYQPDLGPHAQTVASDPQGWVRSVHELKSRYFRRLVRHGRVPLRPGVARLVREARDAGLRIAIVTSASRATVRTVLRHALGADLAGHVDVVIGGDDVSRKKPAPDLYLAALERLGVDAAEVIAIEDSGPGLASARAAGIATLITTNDNTVHDDFEGAIAVLDSLGEPGAPAIVRSGDLPGVISVAVLAQALDSAAPRAATRSG